MNQKSRDFGSYMLPRMLVGGSRPGEPPAQGKVMTGESLERVFKETRKEKLNLNRRSIRRDNSAAADKTLSEAWKHFRIKSSELRPKTEDVIFNIYKFTQIDMIFCRCACS